MTRTIAAGAWIAAATLAAAACGSAPEAGREETMAPKSCPVPNVAAGEAATPAAPVSPAAGLRTATFALG